MKVAQNAHELAEAERLSREKALQELAERDPDLPRATLEALLEIGTDRVHGVERRLKERERQERH